MRKLQKNFALEKIKSEVLRAFQDENMSIFLFGSRARDDFRPSSDVDIGFIPKGKFDKSKLVLLRETLENLNIPYKVELVNFSEQSESFTKEALKQIKRWKD